jgi:hypothetical protein
LRVLISEDLLKDGSCFTSHTGAFSATDGVTPKASCARFL